MKTRTARCGHEIPSHPGRQRRWCETCAPTPRKIWRPAKLTCEGCGCVFDAVRYGPPAKRVACSPACRAWIRFHPGLRRVLGTCGHCGCELRRAGAKYCSQRCGDIARGTRPPELPPMRSCALPECGQLFQPKSRRQRCCSELHGKRLCHRQRRADGREQNAPWGDRQRNSYHRRRELIKSTDTGEVRLLEIAERDGWHCHLCNEPVDKALRWPHPMSRSLDHVVPVTRGGAHSPGNVRLAHLFCNTSKGNRLESELTG